MRNPVLMACVVVCLVAAQLSFKPRTAAADLIGQAPTVIEKLFLWKLTLLTDQDDGYTNLDLTGDGETEIMMRVITTQQNHRLVYWDLIDDGIDMDGDARYEFTIVNGDLTEDLDNGRRQFALAMLHETCREFDAPRVQVDLWEVDVDRLGPILTDLGTVLGFGAFAAPELLPVAAASTAVGRILEKLGNHMKHLGTGLHGWGPGTYPPVPEGNPYLYRPSRNFQYELKLDRTDVVDAQNCLEGEGAAIAASRLASGLALPYERDWFGALAVGAETAVHLFTPDPAIISDRLWNAMPRIFQGIDGLTKERRTDVPWLLGLAGDIAGDLRVRRDIVNGLHLTSDLMSPTDDPVRSLVGSCWLVPFGPPLVLDPDRVDPSVYDSVVDATGKSSWVTVHYELGIPNRVQLVVSESSGGLPPAGPSQVIQEFDCYVCDPASVIDGVAVAVGPGNELHVTYVVHLPGGGTELRYAHRDATGWHTETVDDTPGRRYSIPLSLAIDANGRPHIGYGRSTPEPFLHAEVVHRTFADGMWTDSIIYPRRVNAGEPPQCRMVLNHLGAPCFVFTEGRARGGVTPRREGDRLVGSDSLTASALYFWGPPMLPGTCIELDQDLTTNWNQPPCLDIDPNNEPRVVYAEQVGSLSELRHHQRVAGEVWISERVDSSSVPIAPVDFAVDSDGRSHIFYKRGGDDSDLGPVAPRTIHAQQWLPGGGLMSPAGGPDPDTLSIVPGDTDSTMCSWRREVKEELLRATREALVTEIEESVAASGDPGLRLQSEADMAAGDSHLASHTHYEALAAYRQGILRLAVENHGGGSVLVPPPATPNRPSLVSVRPDLRSGWIRVVFELATREVVRVELYDVQGRQRAVLVDEVAEAGPHERHWAATSGGGSALSPGIYFATLRTPSGGDRMQVVLLQ